MGDGKSKSKVDLRKFGQWYIPSGCQKLEGYLVRKKERYYLDLFTSINFENQKLSTRDPTQQFYSYPLINGVGNNMGGCTLYGCRCSALKQIGETLFRLRFEVQFVFLDTLIGDVNNLKVTEGSFSFSHLSTWYDGSKSISRLSPHTGIFVDGKEQQPTMRNAEKRVAITDNMEFTFVDFFAENSNFSNTLERKFKKYLKIAVTSPVHFDELLSSAAYFSNLLEVCLFRRITFSIHWVRFADDGLSHLEDTALDTSRSSRVLNYSIAKGEKVVDGFFHQNHMLISRWKFNENVLDAIIRCWFSNRSFSHLYDYFIDSHFWTVGKEHFITNVMFNNRYLNMLHGLEGFHDLFYGKEGFDNADYHLKKSEAVKQIKDSQLKQWVNNNLNPQHYKYQTLNDKINHLFDEFEPFLALRFGNNISVTRKFFLRSVKYRNFLSHGSQKSTNQGDELNKIFLAVQYLLALCILKSLKIDSVKKTIEHNEHLNGSANEIIVYINDHYDEYSSS